MRRFVTALFLLATLTCPLAAQTQTSACSAISLGDMGSLNGWVPSPNDAWHQDISASPVDPNSNKIMTTSGDLANRYLHPDFSNIVDGAYGIPYTVVDSTAVLLVTITPWDSDDSDNTLFPLPTNVAIEGTPGQCWSDSADHHAIVLDRTTCTAYEIYQADLCSGQWTSYGNVIWDFTLPNGEKRPYGMSSVDAAGLSVFEGLIRYDEIVAGQINHAIRFTATHTRNDTANGYFTAPAVHAAGNLWGTDNIMGMRIRLKAGFDMSGYSSTNQIILTAMKKYGMILADNGGDLFFQGTPDPRWNDDDLNALKAIPNTAFEVVQMGPVYDQYSAPTGPSPQINSFTASVASVVSGSPVVLTPNVNNASYDFIDNAGFTRGPLTVHPTQTTTYTLWSRNTYGTSTSSVTVNVTPAGSTALSFSNITNQVFGNAPFAVTAASNSPGVITYSVVSGPATLSGSVVTLTGTGTVKLLATQAASGSYPAATANAQFTVSSSTPNLLFSPIPDQNYSSGSIPITATSNSSGAITYSVLNGAATVTGNTVMFTGTGTIAVQASQVAANGFQAATTSALFTVFGAAPTLGFAPIATQSLGAAPFTVSATSNSSGAITYTVYSGPATITGSVVTVTGTGAVTLQARQAASGGYTAASALTAFSVTAATPTLSFTSIANQTYGAAPFPVSATSNSPGAITYSISSGPATIAGHVVTVTGTGTVTIQASQAASGSYLAAAASTSFQVSGAAPTLAFVPAANQTYGAAPFAVSATSNSTGTITYSVASGPATLAGSIVSLTGTGTVTLQAAQAASGSYLAATASTSFQVSGAAPTLAVASIANQTYGVAPFAVSAASNSTGAITYSVASGPATIAGSMVTLTGTGTVTLQASQAASGGYTAGTASTSFQVAAAAPTLAVAAIANQTYGAAPLAVSATSNSSGAITYSVTSGPATLSGNMVTLTGTGTVTIQAAQSASGGYLARTASTTFQVSGTAPTLAVAPISNQTYGVASFPVSATSNSNAPIAYSITSGPATLAGNVITLTGTGAVTIQASQAASGNYTAATATAAFNVTGNGTNLAFTPLATQTYGIAPFAVSATSSSPATISYTVVSGPAMLSGNILTLTAPGSVTIQAIQPAVTGYTAASVNTTFTVNPIATNLVFAPIAAQTFGGAPFAVSATSNSSAPVTYSVAGGPATVAGNIVTLTGGGSVTLQASQAAFGNYAAATLTTTFSVSSATTAIVFSPVAAQTFGGAPFAVSANSNSPASVTYTVVTGPATLAGNIVTLTGTGAVTLEAAQAATAGYNAASVKLTFAVSPASANLAFAPIAAQAFGATPFTVAATSNSPGAITYTVLSGPATLSSNLVTLTGSGAVTLQASQATSGGYAAATAVTTFNVNAAAANLAFAPIAAQAFGVTPFTVAATSNSPGTITYTVLSGPATLSGNLVSLTGSGAVTLQASQGASGGYAAATGVTTFTVNAAAANLALAPIAAQAFGATPFTVAATSNSPGAITYTVLSGPATLSSSTLSLTGPGVVTIRATQAAAGGYTSATAVTSFTVNVGITTLTLATIPPQVYGSGPLTVAAHSNSPGAITYAIVSGPAAIAGNSVVFTSIGTVVLQASQAASGSFAAASATVSFTVDPINPNLVIAGISTQTFGSGPLTVSATSASAAPITYAVLSGPAAITENSLALSGTGSVTIQATQPAAGNYLAGTATTSFTISPSSVVLAGDFAMPNNITITIKQGATGTVSVPVSAVNGFAGIVTFQCAVPANMIQGTCGTTNASLVSATAASSTVTIGTGAVVQTAQTTSLTARNAATGLAFLAVLLPCGLPVFSRRRIDLRRLTLGLLLALTLAATTLTTTGCGSIINGLFTSPGTYVLPVKAVAGNASHTLTITVIVQPAN